MKAKLKILLVLTVFSYGLMLYLALLQTVPGQPLQFHADAPIWLTLQAMLSLWLTRRIERRQPSSTGQHPTDLFRAAVRSFSVSLLLFVPLMVALQLLIDLGRAQPLFAQQYLRVGLMYMLVHSLVSGSYLFWRGLKRQQAQQLLLISAEQKNQQYKLQLLQQQLDPHFLFNNLNVLSVLIHKNAEHAEQFLESFAEIYRYQLQQSSKPSVLLSEELHFSRQYLALLQHRFADSFQVCHDITEQQAAAFRLVPCTLQLLIENAVKHNRASPSTPLHILLEVDDDFLVVRHPLRVKTFAQPGTGNGLTNLMQRCLALMGTPIVVEKHDEFIVKVPMQING